MENAKATLLQLPKISDARGSLTFVENDRQVPFAIKRVFYLYDVPAGESRGGHAHRELHQFLVCLGGSFEVTLDNGHEKSAMHLRHPWEGLHIPPMIWSTQENFTPGAICLVLASDFFNESDYVRDYSAFLELARQSGP